MPLCRRSHRTKEDHIVSEPRFIYLLSIFFHEVYVELCITDSNADGVTSVLRLRTNAMVELYACQIFIDKY